MGDWAGKVVVLPASAAELPPGALAVVVADADAATVGAAVARLQAGGARVCGYVGDSADGAVAEMAAELFPGAEVVVAPAT